VTPEQVEAVEASWAGLRPHLSQIADRFYQRLFEAHPEVRALFPDDLVLQRVKFADELDTLVTAIPDFTSFRSRAVSLGDRHHSYGVLPRHYPWVRDALLGALAESSSAWDEHLEAAWTQAYDLVAELMMTRTVGQGG
jgi:nitric oxide dioxygenase